MVFRQKVLTSVALPIVANDSFFSICTWLEECFISRKYGICFILQNKCVRYWPDEDQSKELKDQNSQIIVKHVSEKSTADYTLREFLVTNDGEVTILLFYFFQINTNQLINSSA